MTRGAALAIATALLVTSCVLADTETRPPTAEAAEHEARQMLEEIGASSMGSLQFVTDQWAPSSGCATHPNMPEQGDVGLILFRSYPEVPEGDTIETLLADQEERWEAAGHTVGRGSPEMVEQVITRVNGIGYAVVSAPPGVELRAYVQCY